MIQFKKKIQNNARSNDAAFSKKITIPAKRITEEK